MNEPSENKLLSLLVEIQSDIRQIKSDLQSLLTFLKERSQHPCRRLMVITRRTLRRAVPQLHLRRSFGICESFGARTTQVISQPRQKPMAPRDDCRGPASERS